MKEIMPGSILEMDRQTDLKEHKRKVFAWFFHGAIKYGTHGHILGGRSCGNECGEKSGWRARGARTH